MSVTRPANAFSCVLWIISLAHEGGMNEFSFTTGLVLSPTKKLGSCSPWRDQVGYDSTWSSCPLLFNFFYIFYNFLLLLPYR